MGRDRPSERQRVPAPLLRRRLPSGRGAIEQPNATSDGDAALTPVFWVAVLVTGVAAGLLGALMMALLFAVQKLAFGYDSGSYLQGVRNASALRTVLVPLIAGAFTGVGWYLVRRFGRGKSAEVDDALWNGTGELSFRRSLATSTLSEIAVGAGASLGREAAPKLLGGASASLLARWVQLTPAQRRLLVSCGAGAGLGAVYNVPLGGALFTVEILVGSITLPTVLPALACSGLATLVSHVYLPRHAVYEHVPNFHWTGGLLGWSVLAGPLIGLAASAFVRTIGWVGFHRASGRRLLWAPAVAFGILGLIGLRYPELFGNGIDIVAGTLVGHPDFGLLLALFLLKPLVTSMCLGSGASGGLFTPVLSIGTLLGALLGTIWSHAFSGVPLGAYSMVGGAAMIGASMQAPLTGLVLMIELTQTGFPIMLPMLIATVLATAVTRYVDGYSIYSARLPALPN